MSRILVIEDDRVIVNLLHRVLVGAGYVVQDAANGKTGLAAYRQQPSDLVITDIVMPDLEGLEMIRELCRYDARVKIVAISGGGVGSASNYLELALKFGAGWILGKPFTHKELLAVVAEAIATSPQAPGR